MDMKEMKVKLCLLDEALGMMPADKELHETYIASKAPDAPSIDEEVAAVVAFLFREDAAYVTRQVISVNGGLF